MRCDAFEIQVVLLDEKQTGLARPRRNQNKETLHAVLRLLLFLFFLILPSSRYYQCVFRVPLHEAPIGICVRTSHIMLTCKMSRLGSHLTFTDDKGS
jgi:hypothetical protein